MYFDDNKQVIITEAGSVCLDLSKNGLKYEISSIVKHNEFSVKQKIKHVVIQNLSSCCTWKDIRQQYRNKNLRIIAPTWNDVLKLEDGSYSVPSIQGYF